VALVGEAGGAETPGPMVALAIAACVVAAICYALAGIYIKKFVKGLTSTAISTGSQIMAGLLLLPLAIAFPPTGIITAAIVGNVLGLSLVCSGVAYLIYYKLMADLGPTKALTVTFLIPPFGIVWGMIFLDEPLTWGMAAGCVLVILGTLLVVREPAPAPLSSTA
jgi:drug/metabolite transporter (DMT)-like permease